MAWAKVTKIPYMLPHLSKALFPPDEYAMFKDNFATGNGKL